MTQNHLKLFSSLQLKFISFFCACFITFPNSFSTSYFFSTTPTEMSEDSESTTAPVKPEKRPKKTAAASTAAGGGSGLGKGKGLRAQQASKRHRKPAKEPILGITKPAIRRLARRGGVKRLSGLIYEETRGVMKNFLTSVLKDSTVYTLHARRKTITAMDVVSALKRNGKVLYGFGG